jgi:hypothetical protein
MQRSTHHPAKPLRWRPLAWAATALTAVGLTAGIATAALAAAPNPAPGVAPGTTAVATNNFIFYTAANGSVWQKVLDSGLPATAVGGRLISAPSPITTASGSILVFGEGTDHALWVTTCAKGGTCTAWTSLGGVLTSKPGAVTAGPGESVYVRGSDGTLWANDNPTGGSWSGWHSLAGRLLAGTGPAAAYNGTNQFVLVVGTDQRTYLLQVGTAGFTLKGGRTTASPGFTITSDGLLWGFVRGTDNAGWYSNLTGTTWTSFGGIVTSGFSATANNGSHSPPTIPYAYALGQDGQVWQNGGPSPTNWSAVTP